MAAAFDRTNFQANPTRTDQERGRSAWSAAIANAPTAQPPNRVAAHPRPKQTRWNEAPQQVSTACTAKPTTKAPVLSKYVHTRRASDHCNCADDQNTIPQAVLNQSQQKKALQKAELKMHNQKETPTANDLNRSNCDHERVPLHA
jgi:transaldolase